MSRRRVTYGDDPSQWVQVTEPSRARGTVVLIHGGFWKAMYDASYVAPLAADLVARGWRVATAEYRRVGDGPGGGGGWPATFDDIDAAINEVATSGPLVALGHSAGGHLATGAAARTRFDRWAGGAPITHVVSLAGVLDLTAAHDQDLGSGAVRALMGAGPSDRSYDLADPMRHLPLDVPVWAVHARDDEDVPFSQSEAYVRASGDGARLVEVAGGHFGLVDVRHEAWRQVANLLDTI